MYFILSNVLLRIQSKCSKLTICHFVHILDSTWAKNKNKILQMSKHLFLIKSELPPSLPSINTPAPYQPLTPLWAFFSISQHFQNIRQNHGYALPKGLRVGGSHPQRIMDPPLNRSLILYYLVVTCSEIFTSHICESSCPF